MTEASERTAILEGVSIGDLVVGPRVRVHRDSQNAAVLSVRVLRLFRIVQLIPAVSHRPV